MEQEILDNDLLLKSTEQQRVFAGFWERVGAALIDGVVYLPVIGINAYNLYWLKSLPLQLITTLVLLAYKPFMEYRYGASLGKMALKIKVVGKDADQLTIQQAVIRHLPTALGQILSAITAVLLFMNSDFQSADSMFEVAALQNAVMSPIPNYLISTFYLVSCLTVAFSASKQAIHDMMAGTFCVKQ